MYLTLVEYSPSRVDSKGLRQLLFDRQLDSFHAAIHAELVEDVRNVEFDCAKTDHKSIGDLIVIESLDHAFEYIPFSIC